MALASYSDLKTSIASFLHRGDLTSRIPDFIVLAETQMRRRLRTAEMVGRATASVSTEFAAVPSDFGGVKTFDLATNPVTQLKFLSADQMTEELRYNPGVGKPRFFSVVGTEFRFLPVPDTTYSAEITYYKDVPALSDVAPTNWLLTKHPDAYLYGSLLQAAPYIRDDVMAGTWGALFTAVMDDIVTADQRSSYGTPLNMRRRSFG